MSRGRNRESAWNFAAEANPGMRQAGGRPSAQWARGGVRVGCVWAVLSLALLAQKAGLPPEAGSIVAVGDGGAVVYTNVQEPETSPRPVTVRRPRTTARVPAAIGRILDQTAQRYDLDPRLVREVARQESDFDAASISGKGAMGLMQLMPETARELGVRHPFNPTENADGGARYLKTLLGRFGGDIPLTLAAYNAGPGSVERYGNRIPPFAETQAYVKTITRRLRSGPPSARPAPGAHAAPAPPVVLEGRDRQGNPVFSNLP